MKSKIAMLCVGILVGMAVSAPFVFSQPDPAYGGSQWAAQGFFPGQTTVVDNPVPGDVNRDGAVTVSDIVAINYLMKWSYLADVNADNRINIDDANYLYEYVMQNGDAPIPLVQCKKLWLTRDCSETP